MASRRPSFILDRELQLNTTLREKLFAEIDFKQNLIYKYLRKETKNMSPIICIQFSYLGSTRYVICDVDTRYEKIQELVAKTFSLPEECIPAIHFSDGLNYLFNKDLFEYFILLFPEPCQIFYVRLDFSKVGDSRIAYKTGKMTTKDTNKRTHQDMIDADGEEVIPAAPLRRSNCFIGIMPESDSGTVVEPEIFEIKQQPRKRMRLMQSGQKNKIKLPSVKSVLRI